MGNKRVAYLDIAKGIGIIMVVWAHARGPFSNYMYLFHMPLFFLISGYLYSENKPLKQFLIGKIKSIYIPFVFWNVLVVAVKTIINPERLVSNMKLTGQILLTLNKDGQFFGATWFLGSLFLVSVSYKLLDTYLHDWEYRYPFIFGSFAALSIVGFEINLPLMFSRTLILGLFYGIGHMIKRMPEEWKGFDRPLIALLALAIFIVIGRYNSANMGANEYKYYFSFVFGALCASYGVIFGSKIIDQISEMSILKKVLCFLGQKSLDIVIWQFVAFRLVIAMQLYREGLPLNSILDYYPVYSVEHGWWIIYMLIGLGVPILWGDFLRWIVRPFKRLIK